MKNTDVIEVLDQIKGQRVLVIGDVMIDQYLNGSVSRISPEAPVPILMHDQTILLPGGAANVAVNLAGLDTEVWLASVIGEDEMGTKLIGLLRDQQIRTDLVHKSSQRMTTCKTRIMAGKQHLLRVDQERREEIQEDILDILLQDIEKTISTVRFDMVILQDYNKGILSQNSIGQFLSLFARHEIAVAVDPKYDNFFAYMGVEIFKPNLSELRASLPFSVEINSDSLAKAAEYIRGKLNCKTILITLSDKGIYIDRGQERALLPAPEKLIADVCGAGDTVISVASLASSANLDLRDIAFWASYCGTLVCQYPGVKPISRKILLE